jgi:hypothetical protein
VIDLGTIASEWAGWRFDGPHLIDPVGNRYSPDDLRAVHWIRQAWAARAGYPGELAFLRDEAVRRLEEADRPWVVTIQRETRGGLQRLGQLRLGSSGPVLVTLDLSPMDGKTPFRNSPENRMQAVDSQQDNRQEEHEE